MRYFLIGDEVLVNRNFGATGWETRDIPEHGEQRAGRIKKRLPEKSGADYVVGVGCHEFALKHSEVIRKPRNVKP